jgi:hypothetical protein
MLTDVDVIEVGTSTLISRRKHRHNTGGVARNVQIMKLSVGTQYGVELAGDVANAQVPISLGHHVGSHYAPASSFYCQQFTDQPSNKIFDTEVGRIMRKPPSGIHKIVDPYVAYQKISRPSYRGSSLK